MHAFDIDSFLRESAQAIWNQKMLGRIPELYAPHALIHLGGGETLHGDQQLLDRAVQWLAAFPDLRVFIDDLISVQRGSAYLASVRWTAVAHNTGPSAYGPATRRRVVVSGITNARIEGGRFVEQWVELGDGGLVRHLGFDEHSVVRRLWPKEAASDFDDLLGQGVVERATSSAQGSNALNDNPPADAGALISAAVEGVWNRRQVGEVERFFAPGYREHGPGSRALFGSEELQMDILSLLGAFPDLHMHLDDVFWVGELHHGCLSSARWTLLGTNSGPSAHGPPTNAYLRLSGISNHRIQGGQIVEGWTAYSELGLARRLVQSAPCDSSEDTDRERLM